MKKRVNQKMILKQNIFENIILDRQDMITMIIIMEAIHEEVIERIEEEGIFMIDVDPLQEDL